MRPLKQKTAIDPGAFEVKIDSHAPPIPKLPVETIPDLPAQTHRVLPGTQQADKTGATTVGRQTSPPEITAPQLNLAAALADPTFQALDPAKIPVPAELLEAIRNAKHIVVVGHVRTDLDTAGAVFELAGLPGKKVDVVIADELPGSVKKALGKEAQTLRTVDDLLNGPPPDLVLYVDHHVARQSGDATRIAKHAKKVGVIDHHLGSFDPEKYGITPDKLIPPWIDTQFPAAGLMAAAVLGQFQGSTSRTATLALYAIGTDTMWGNRPNADVDSFRYFKHLYNQSGTPLEQLIDATEYKPPARVLRAIDRMPPANLPGKQPIALLSCPEAQFSQLLKMVEPRGNHHDLGFALKRHADRAAQENPTVILLFEPQPGVVSISVRSQLPQVAEALAEHFGGGGRDGVAYAEIKGRSLKDVQETIAGLAKNGLEI